MILKRLFRWFCHHSYSHDADFILDKNTGLKYVIECELCGEAKNPRIVFQILWDNYFINQREEYKMQSKMLFEEEKLRLKPIFDKLAEEAEERKNRSEVLWKC